MEGLLHRLLDKYDPVARKCLQQAVFYVVSPSMRYVAEAADNLSCKSSLPLTEVRDGEGRLLSRAETRVQRDKTKLFWNCAASQ